MQNDSPASKSPNAIRLDLVSAFELTPGEVSFVDLSTLQITWINNRARVNLGYKLSELQNLGTHGFITGVTDEELKTAIASLTTGDSRTIAMQLAHTRSDGSVYPVDSQLQILGNNGQQVLVVFSDDGSDRLELLDELETANLYLEAAPDATVVIDEQGRIVTSNTQTERLLGYDKKELAGRHVEFLIPQRFRTTHVAHRQGFTNNPTNRGMGNGLSLFASSKSGNEIPIEVSLSPIKSGKQTLVAAALRDMTQRNAAEKELRDSETRYRELFNTATDLIQSFNIDGRLEFVNPAWLNAMGYDLKELKELNFFDLIAPASKEQANQLVTALQHGKQIQEVRLTCLTKAGAELNLEGSVSGHDSENSKGWYRAIFHDVTERTHYEATLRNAKDEAEDATAGKSRFLAAASHDLRQPLQALRLYLSVMDRLPKSGKHEEIITKMSASIDTMGELLDALLDISRLGSGAIQPVLSNFSSDSLLENIFASNAQQAKEKGLRLSRTGDSYPLYSDPGLLARVIDNFVTNAIRYTETGTIELRAERCSDGVILSVADSGIGIEKEELERIFEEYFQVENSVRDRKKGLGLGLSIVKHIAILLDHKIEVTSTKGLGSVFSIIVPAGGESTGKQNTQTDQTSVPSEAPLRVIFVDDDEAIVDATKMLLETADIDVVEFFDGESAIQALTDGERPDVIVSDYRLPGKNGVDVIRHARGIFGTDLPAILMSGDTTIQELSKDALANCTLLRKPVDTNALINLITDLADQ